MGGAPFAATADEQRERALEERVRRLEKTVDELTRHEKKEIKDKLLQLGWKVESTSPKALTDRIASDTATYGALIKAKGYKLD